MTDVLPAAPPALQLVRHPLREPDFRSLWSANIISNIGVWMQTVGGAWLMTTLTGGRAARRAHADRDDVPALLVGLPAGSLADRVDRRQLSCSPQAWMLGMVSLMAVLTLWGS